MLNMKKETEFKKFVELTNFKSDSLDLPSKDTERVTWGSQLDFILSCIGYAVGLGNVWRFPYLCFRNGGASFLIPYFIMLVIAGLPLFIFELGLCQFPSLGPTLVWKAVPLFKGIGFCMVTISFLVCVYYNVIIAWTLHYLFTSFTSGTLPWATCDNAWNDGNCSHINATRSLSTQSGAEQYWERYVLGVTSENGVQREASDIGGFQWELVLALFLAWIVVFACLAGGIKIAGKVVYFTATFPYIVLLALFINGLTLDGAWKGIKFYLVPDFSRLLDISVWADATSQIFYSVGIGFGSLGTLSSYNRFNNNFYRDSLIVAGINCGTSFFAGFIVFSVVGFMSVQTGLEISDVIKSGPGLVFIVYPEGISRMPLAAFWSILFFVMLLLLGLDSQFAMFETVITALSDECDYLRQKKLRKVLAVGLSAIVCAIPGFLLVTKAGIYYFSLFDNYSGSYSLFLVAMCEVCVICYIYGYKNFRNDIKMMLGKHIPMYWTVCWMATIPTIVLVLLLLKFIQWQPSSYGDYEFPFWMELIGFVFGIISVSCIPGYILYLYVKSGNIKQFLKPSDDWGPAIPENWNLDDRYVEKRNRLDAANC